jgi:hypothetical protein
MELEQKILIVVIAIFIILLAAVLFKLNQLVKLFSNQAVALQSRTEPLLEEAQKKLQLIERRGEPIMEEAHQLLVTARPALEQLTGLLESAKPILTEAHATVLLAKETATLAKSTAGNLKVEAEACLAAIRTTATEVSKITLEEAQDLREVVTTTRTRAEEQIVRLDDLVTRTTVRLDETTQMVQTGVIKPVSELAAVLAGVQRFLQVLFAKERKQVDEAYQDEEMFI